MQQQRISTVMTSNIAVLATALNVAALIGLSRIATPYMVIASVAYSAMFWGFLFRKQRTMHVWLMNFAIIMDISLVLLLEFQRDAIAEAMKFTLGFWQQAHIGASTIALLLYFPILYLGWGRQRNKLKSASSRNWHIRLGVAAFIFRTAGFFLMFSMLSHVMK